MLAALLSPVLMQTDQSPLIDAIAAASGPSSLRAAFTVELRSGDDWRVFSFDPRWPQDARWRLVSEQGENDELDEVAANWGADAAPDGRLFPDGLRSSLKGEVEVEDFGDAWRINYLHRPLQSGNEMEAWAAVNLQAAAWLDPVAGRFLRVDHVLPTPTISPQGPRLLSYRQSHFLETDPQFGLSYISKLTVELEARAAFRRVRRAYTVRVQRIELFFASASDQAAFEAQRNLTASP